MRHKLTWTSLFYVLCPHLAGECTVGGGRFILSKIRKILFNILLLIVFNCHIDNIYMLYSLIVFNCICQVKHHGFQIWNLRFEIKPVTLKTLLFLVWKFFDIWIYDKIKQLTKINLYINLYSISIYDLESSNKFVKTVLTRGLLLNWNNNDV